MNLSDINLPKRNLSGSSANTSEKGSNSPLADVIAQSIASLICHGTLAPGMRIEEQDICKKFKTSRTPAREALRQLAAKGLVEIKPRQGAFVIQLKVDRVIEMFETMGFLEAACAALAARRHDLQDREALSDAHQQCEYAAAANDPELFYAANTAFHECIYRASHNRHLESQTLELRNRLEVYRREATFHAGLMAVSIKEHASVLQSILDMKEEDAASQMHKHLDTLRKDALSMAAMITRTHTY